MRVSFQRLLRESRKILLQSARLIQWLFVIPMVMTWSNANRRLWRWSQVLNRQRKGLLSLVSMVIRSAIEFLAPLEYGDDIARSANILVGMTVDQQ